MELKNFIKSNLVVDKKHAVGGVCTGCDYYNTVIIDGTPINVGDIIQITFEDGTVRLKELIAIQQRIDAKVDAHRSEWKISPTASLEFTNHTQTLEGINLIYLKKDGTLESGFMPSIKSRAISFKKV